LKKQLIIAILLPGVPLLQPTVEENLKSEWSTFAVHPAVRTPEVLRWLGYFHAAFQARQASHFLYRKQFCRYSVSVEKGRIWRLEYFW